MDEIIKRPSLGQIAALGTLYDARTDTFVPISLLGGQPPPEAVTRTDIPNTVVKMSRSDTYKEKFNCLGVGAALRASFLAGFVSSGGSGCYLAEKRDTNLVMQASLLYKITTVNETWNFAAEAIERALTSNFLDMELATHIVTEIAWGACHVVTAKRIVSQGDKLNQIETRLEEQFKAFMAPLCSGKSNVMKSDSFDFDDTFEVTIYGDFLANNGSVPTDFKSASKVIGNVPGYIAAINGKGKRLIYTMFPLSNVARRLDMDIPFHFSIKNLSDDSSEKFVGLFEEIRCAEQTLSDYEGFVQVLEGRSLEADLKCNYASILKAVRSGEADDQELWQLLEDFRTKYFALNEVSFDRRPYTKKVKLVQGLVDRGAEYVGFNGEPLDTALARSPSIDTYVFSFSEEARLGSAEWSPNLSIVEELLDNKDRNIRVLLKDCDAFNEQLATPKISLVRNTRSIKDDMLMERKLREGNCVTRYDNAHLDCSVMGKPLKRIPVRISWPGTDCSSGEKHDWVCFHCGCIVQYGINDQFLYCNCGRCEHQYWEFRCTDKRHGVGFKKHNSRKLLHILGSLKSFEDLNILILGPTGVGKSTWINAFANYLVFSLLDDALKADKLCWVIPFSFCTYTQREGKFENINVRVGFENDKDGVTARDSSTHKLGASEDEHDGSSAGSATQRTRIHLLQIGSTMVRLIDTPGVGDTRGPSKDKENMADILRALRQYDKLHGILILLKPNDQRLTLMFRFCIQELLTHLHRKAAQNIAFGFTNTRGTNYKPGDSFNPLHVLLGQYREVEIGLHPHNVYCFDSESFRYLAAFKQYGQELGDQEENRRSWDHSVFESWRLLNYFKSLEPHQVKSTLNLNEIRHQIVKLTVPMAEIADAIQGSINVNEDDLKELEHKDMTKKDLEAKLRIDVDVVYLVLVDKPRTTCSHVDCIEDSNVGIEGSDGKPVLKTVFKSLCHSPCRLKDVATNTIAHPDLQFCGMMKEGVCRKCGHMWNTHLHVKYEVQHGKKTINDPGIEEALMRNASDRELKQKAIETKKKFIQKLRTEQDQITDAAAHFSMFLKRNSIIYYNDATLKYLDRHMEDEQRKVRAGGSGDKLESLKRYRSQYEKQVEVLETYLAKGENHNLLDQRGVEQCLVDLRSLELYGESVKRVLDDDVEEEMACREGPHIIRARPHFTKTASRGNASNEDSQRGSFATIETILSWGGRVWSGLPFGPIRNSQAGQGGNTSFRNSAEASDNFTRGKRTRRWS